MKLIIKFTTAVLLVAGALAAPPALAALNIFACEPEWGATRQDFLLQTFTKLT